MEQTCVFIPLQARVSGVHSEAQVLQSTREIRYLNVLCALPRNYYGDDLSEGDSVPVWDDDVPAAADVGPQVPQ